MKNNLPSRQGEMPYGTVATTGHPANHVLIVKGDESQWFYVHNGKPFDMEDGFRGTWDLYVPPEVLQILAVEQAEVMAEVGAAVAGPVQVAEHARRRRAPVQASAHWEKPAGTVDWAEHLLAWRRYAQRYGASQSAERIAERTGFSYGEMVDFLHHEPITWEPA